ncbi:MAG: hypothetical protein WDM96_09685 [Lacunisphaera sp.]
MPPTNADHVGGKIALIAPNVTNAGTINTDDGQAILAAGLQIGFAPHRSSDPTLRGLDVFVGAVAAARRSAVGYAGAADRRRGHQHRPDRVEPGQHLSHGP